MRDWNYNAANPHQYIGNQVGAPHRTITWMDRMMLESKTMRPSVTIVHLCVAAAAAKRKKNGKV